MEYELCPATLTSLKKLRIFSSTYLVSCCVQADDFTDMVLAHNRQKTDHIAILRAVSLDESSLLHVALKKTANSKRHVTCTLRSENNHVTQVILPERLSYNIAVPRLGFISLLIKLLFSASVLCNHYFTVTLDVTQKVSEFNSCKNTVNNQHKIHNSSCSKNNLSPTLQLLFFISKC